MEFIIRLFSFNWVEYKKQGVKNSKLIPFVYGGHGSFYDECDKFNKELMNYIKE